MRRTDRLYSVSRPARMPGKSRRFFPGKGASRKDPLRGRAGFEMYAGIFVAFGVFLRIDRIVYKIQIITTGEPSRRGAFSPVANFPFSTDFQVYMLKCIHLFWVRTLVAQGLRYRTGLPHAPLRPAGGGSECRPAPSNRGSDAHFTRFLRRNQAALLTPKKGLLVFSSN